MTSLRNFLITAVLAAATVSAVDITTSGPWNYQFDQDGMGRPQQTVWTYSTNHLDFGFPYQGTQSGKLALRTTGREREIMLSIERGQFMCGVAVGCVVNVRFDEGKILHYCGSRPSDGSSNVLFLSQRTLAVDNCDNYFIRSSFIPNLYKAKRVRIEANFFREGMQTLEFNVEGLK
jgi:hypothetical protein